jgi:hypothetical protein
MTAKKHHYVHVFYQKGLRMRMACYGYMIEISRRTSTFIQKWCAEPRIFMPFGPRMRHETERLRQTFSVQSRA